MGCEFILRRMWWRQGRTAADLRLQHFAFYSGLRGLFLKPMHVGTVHVRGLAVNIPPREDAEAAPEGKQPAGKIKILVDEIVLRRLAAGDWDAEAGQGSEGL